MRRVNIMSKVKMIKKDEMKDVFDRINDGSATTEDYAKFFGLFDVDIMNSDGTYKSVYQVFEEAHNNWQKRIKDKNETLD